MIDIPYLPGGLAGIFILVCLLFLRQQRQAGFERRRQQLASAARLFDSHGEAMQEFLARPSANLVLKQTLIQFSDSLSNPDHVLKLAMRLVQGDRHAIEQDDEELLAALAAMRSKDQDLFACFVTAIVSGAFGAILRWPESAVYFEEVSANLAADRKRDVDVVVTASRFRPYATPAFGMTGSAVA